MLERFERVKQVISRSIEQGTFPCAVAEIGDVHGPIWRYAEGMRQVKPELLPADEDTIFDMASVSKILSATMVSLTMFEEGILSPTDELGLFWEGLPEKSARMTVRQLLTHSSGLPGGKSIVGFPKDTIAEEILKSEDILHGSGSYEAETQVSYACLGFIVLGELLEKLGGKPLDVLAKECVFDPLGMKNTGYAPKGDNIAATGFNEPVKGVVNDYNARYLARPVGNAGVFSTAEDCGKFARMLLKGGEPIVSAPTIAAANQNLTPYSNMQRGLGFYRFRQKQQTVCDLCSPTVFGHSGWTGTSVMVDPELGFYVVLLSNRTCKESFDQNEIWRVRRYVHNAAVAAWIKG